MSTHYLLPRGVVIAAAACLTLTACSSPEPPSELEVPDVVWPAGSPSGELESSPWVQAVRNAEVQSSVAWNNLDYSSPDLIAAWGYDTVQDPLFVDAQLRFVPDLYETSPEAPGLLDWGPNPLVPVSVEETQDGAIVRACAVFNRTIGTGEIERVGVRDYTVTETEWGTAITYEDSGESITELGLEQCMPENIETPLFSPAPALPTVTDDGMRPPAERSVYETE